MNALVAAAKKEGTLNVIALPPTWANYGNILKAFTAKYGIKINSALPDGSSQQEVNAVKSQHGTAKAPDVLDVGMAVALANTSLFAPYQVSTWSDIPTAQKESTGLWVQDYGGYMAIGYSSKYGTITSLNDLLGPKFKGAVALNGNPTSANAALNGVMMASLAEGGSASSISPGVNFFEKLKKAGNFNPVQATGATIKAGTTQVVFNWDYLNLPSYVGVSNWKVFIPQNAVLGGYYAQAINKGAPHPAAARLWEEFLYSQAAGSFLGRHRPLLRLRRRLPAVADRDRGGRLVQELGWRLGLRQHHQARRSAGARLLHRLVQAVRAVVGDRGRVRRDPGLRDSVGQPRRRDPAPVPGRLGRARPDWRGHAGVRLPGPDRPGRAAVPCQLVL
jgi:putative spermidine/putrescine transport system substrate-binding protein